MYGFRNERGAALIFVFIIFIALSGVAMAFLSMVSYEIKSTGTGLNNMKAFYIAEAGLAKARWALTTGGEAVGWGETDTIGGGNYTVTTTDNLDGTYTIESSGYVPNSTNPIAKRRVVEENITASSGLPNLSLSATAQASSEQGPNVASNANDGDSGTKWKSNVKNGSWLKLDFGSSTTFDRVVYSGAKIDSYTIEFSSDDSSYNAVTGAVESPSGTVNFDLVSARYLRFSVNGNRPEVNELESYNSIGGSSTTLGQGKFITSW